MSAKIVRKPRSRWALFAGMVAGIVVFMGLALFVFARVEEQDSFCASCHTEPEVAYFKRAQAAGATDLASAHAMLYHTHADAASTRCIDCHSGEGISGRLSSMGLGVRDAVRWVTGTAIQPALQTVPIADANCLKCHAETPAKDDFDNHFHHYLAQWQEKEANAGTCVSCHSSHTTDGNANIGFLQQQRTQAQCERCHTALNANE